MVTNSQKKVGAKKTTANKPAKKAAVTLSKAPVAKKQDDLKAMQAFWGTEIKELQNKKFNSYSSAVDSLLDRVCERLQVPASKRSQTIERLSVIFETSDLLKQSLTKHLKIKK